MLYDDKSELLQEIAAGEDTLLELKEVVFKGDQVRFAGEEGRAAKVIAEVLVSMANTEGGLVVFGVNSRGGVIGVDPTKRESLEQFAVNCSLNNCLPPLEPRLDWIFLPGITGDPVLCLKLWCPQARFSVHQTTDGRFLKRVGSHSAPIPVEQLGRLLASRQLMSPFEERPAFGADLEAINVRRFADYYRRRFGSNLSGSGLPIERLLGNLKLAIQIEDRPWQPTNLGLLLFADRPQEWLNGAYVDIAVYDHDHADGNTRDTRRVIGPIPEQIEGVLTYLRTSPYLFTVSDKDGLGRADRPAYSATAIQEAVVNALAHRDYEVTGAQVILTLFPDRIELRNPGGLHNTLTPENLYAGCQPVRRNQLLVGFLRDYASPVTSRSYMEARGEGFLTLVQSSLALSGQRPDLEVVGKAVRLTIYAGPLEFSEQTSSTDAARLDDSSAIADNS